MKLKINLWSFIFFFVCIALFFLSVSSIGLVRGVTDLFGTHPLNIVLAISFITFLFGLIGSSASINKKMLLRSISTIGITLGLCIVILIITIGGNIFQFT